MPFTLASERHFSFLLQRSLNLELVYSSLRFLWLARLTYSLISLHFLNGLILSEWLMKPSCHMAADASLTLLLDAKAWPVKELAEQ